MKKYLLKVLASTLVAAGCGGSSKDETTTVATLSSSDSDSALEELPCQEDSAGASASTPTALALGKHDGCLMTTEDFYSLQAPTHAAGTVLTLSVESETPTLVSINDANGDEVIGTTVDGKETVHFVLASGTGAVLRISREASTPIGGYSLRLGAKPLTDDDEPNDSMALARPMNLGKPRHSLMQSAANNPKISDDYFRVLVGRRGQLTIKLVPGTDELTADVALIRKDGKEIERSQGVNPGASVSLSSRVGRGEYHVRVSPAENANSRAGAVGEKPRHWSTPYTITASFR